MTTKNSDGESTPAVSNVYVLPSIHRRARHNAVRNFLNDLLEQHNYSPAVAAAAIMLAEDGSVSVSGKGIDPDTSADMLAGALRLARRIELTITPRDAPSERQRGSISFVTLPTIGFSLATYLNGEAWLDALLVLIAQAATLLITTKAKY